MECFLQRSTPSNRNFKMVGGNIVPTAAKLGYKILTDTSQGTRLDVPPRDFIDGELIQFGAKSEFIPSTLDILLSKSKGETAKQKLRVSKENYIKSLERLVGHQFRIRDMRHSTNLCCCRRSYWQSLARIWYPSYRIVFNTERARCGRQLYLSTT